MSTSSSYVIGIAGGSGSGKTSFVQALKERFAEASITFISLDDYYLPREQQHTDEKGKKNFDLPESIKSEELIADLQKILTGESVTKQKYTFNNALAETSTIELRPAKVVVVEGLYIYHYKALKPLLNMKLYIDAPDELKLIRRIKRDKVERNYPLEDVIYRYEHHVMPSYRKHIEIYKSDADLIINNKSSFDKGLDVLASYIRTKLEA